MHNLWILYNIRCGFFDERFMSAWKWVLLRTSHESNAAKWVRHHEALDNTYEKISPVNGKRPLSLLGDFSSKIQGVQRIKYKFIEKLYHMHKRYDLKLTDVIFWWRFHVWSPESILMICVNSHDAFRNAWQPLHDVHLLTIRMIAHVAAKVNVMRSDAS